MKKFDENQFWISAMMIFPTLILSYAGDTLTDNNGMKILYAGVFGGIGGLLGTAAYYLTKEKHRIIKVITLLSLILMSGMTIYFLSSKQSDAKIVKKEWVTQKNRQYRI